MAKTTTEKAAAEFCTQRGVTAKFQYDGSVRGSYYRPDDMGAVRAVSAKGFVDFVSNLAAEEQRQIDAETAEAARLAEEAEIAEVEEAVAAFEPVEGITVGLDLGTGDSITTLSSVDIVEPDADEDRDED